jgi:Ni,Fe-hydrogenase III large subunit/Ni,Fe-hydrogenase III component G
MNNFTHLQSALTQYAGVIVFKRPRPNELHCRFGRDHVSSIARLLHNNFNATLRLIVAEDRRQDHDRIDVHYLFEHTRDNWFFHATTSVAADDPKLPSLATFYYPASRFEREIKDMFGIRPTGNPDARPLVKHAFWPKDYYPLLKDSVPPKQFFDDGTVFPFQTVGGEGVYEIPVGPVHAGIIEPGHFRFSVLGETVIDLKIRLYFTHKGTEKLFEGKPPADGIALAERISGDSTVGHALAYCQALETLAETEVPLRAKYLRVIFLELERIYNHIADFGAIANDTGFAFAHAHCFRLRERILRLNKKLTGNRLLRGAILPGGVACNIMAGDEIDNELADVLADFDEIVEISLRNSLLADRIDGTGCLTKVTAADHGVLGYVARASGLNMDVRRDHPFAAYDRLRFSVPVLDDGDVRARTMVRVKEVQESVSLIRQALQDLPSGELITPLGPLPAFQPAFGMVEGWRGAITHWVSADSNGCIYRLKVHDPSFANWPALSFAFLKNIVPDFPLCNKSFNQSYSGNDL